MYTIICIILASFGTYSLMSLIHSIEHDYHISLDSIISVIMSIMLLLTVRYYNNAVESAYTNGYNDAISSAQLISWDGDTYEIAFGGEFHVYTFDN